MTVTCGICGKTGDPDSPQELAALKAKGAEAWPQGQWAVVRVAGVVDRSDFQEVLACSVTCAVQATIAQAQRLHVRDVARG